MTYSLYSNFTADVDSVVVVHVYALAVVRLYVQNALMIVACIYIHMPVAPCSP